MFVECQYRILMDKLDFTTIEPNQPVYLPLYDEVRVVLGVPEFSLKGVRLNARRSNAQFTLIRQLFGASSSTNSYQTDQLLDELEEHLSAVYVDFEMVESSEKFPFYSPLSESAWDSFYKLVEAHHRYLASCCAYFGRIHIPSIEIYQK